MDAERRTHARRDVAGGLRPHEHHRRSRRGGRHGHHAAGTGSRRSGGQPRLAGGSKIDGASPLDFYFLTDGAQTADSVAQRVAAFLDRAAKTLEIAIYDLRLDAGPADTILASLTAAQK